MPIISQFYGIVIRMFSEENDAHHLPHIHVSYAEYTSVFDFKGNILKGELPNKQKKLVQAWIEIHNKELTQLWKLATKNKKLYKIRPLT